MADLLADVRSRAHRRLLSDADRDKTIDRALVSTIVTDVAPLLSRADFDRVVAGVLADVHGLGVLEPFLHDPGINDIMVVGDRGVWIEKHGEVVETDIVLDRDEAEHLIERIVAPLGLRVDRSSPMVDARLPDGSRVNAVVPPLAVDGPCLTIRRFGARTIELPSVASESVTAFLREAVRAKMNILISGGTGAGKTTLLNALAGQIEDGERIVTVEDAAELRLPIRHVVRLEGRPANSEGVGRISLRDLVRNALRMRPDRIIVGEVRGPEALDMLQAMNTGHEGSMSTCHANTPRDAILRIETMVMMGETGIPLDAIRAQISSSIDLIVQIARVGNGRRAVVDVSEITEADGKLTVRQLANEHGLFAHPNRAKRARTAS